MCLRICCAPCILAKDAALFLVNAGVATVVTVVVCGAIASLGDLAFPLIGATALVYLAWQCRGAVPKVYGACVHLALVSIALVSLAWHYVLHFAQLCHATASGAARRKPRSPPE